MKIRDHVLFQFTIISALVTAFVMVATGVWMGISNRQNLIENHESFYPRIITHMFERDTPVGSLTPRIREHLDLLLQIEAVHAVSLLGPDGAEVWYEENSHNPVPVEDGGADTEAGYRNINIQIEAEGWNGYSIRIVENSEILNRDIRRLVAGNLLIIMFAGLSIFISMYSVYFTAYKRQKRITQRVRKTEDVTIYALAFQAGLRDEETGGHLKRSSEYVRILATDLAGKSRYKEYLSKGYIDDLVKSAPLHDIGKVGVEDSILKKPGKLTPAEFEKIKTHTLLGAKILEEASAELTFTSFLDIAINLVRNHHERWDGMGYPDGLAGEKIPLSARIMALADVYDALRSTRHYKEAYVHEKCMNIIKEGVGLQFDPEVVASFLRNEKEFLRISMEMAD